MDQVDLAALKAKIEEKYDLLLEPAIFIEHSSIDQLSAYLCDRYREALLAVHGGETKPCPQKPENKEPLSLAAIAYTLHNGREAMNQRMAFVADDHAQLLQGLRSYSTGEEEKERFFTGNTRNDAAIPESLLQGSAGRTFIDSLIRERDLKKLAQLWVAGMEIDWRPLYGPRPPLPSPCRPIPLRGNDVGFPTVTQTSDNLPCKRNLGIPAGMRKKCRRST